jgi:hypothetical protein
LLQTVYDRCYSIRTSDHHPVFAQYDVATCLPLP